MLPDHKEATTKSSLPCRRRLTVAACGMALLLMIAMSSAAMAGPYAWDGGHDALGATGPSGTIYFAEGTTRNGFEEYLLLRNPGTDAAVVSINYLFTGSPAQTQEITMAPWSGYSVCVNDVVGPDKDVSVSIRANPGIIAERQCFFNYKSVWTGGHAAGGVTDPRTTWYFAEGTTRPGFQEWLCLQNPTAKDISSTVTFMLGTGETQERNVPLPANSRVTLDVNNTIGAGHDVSMKVAATGTIIAERPMYFEYKGQWRGGDTATGAPATSGQWFFAEGTTRAGFEEWLSIMNPGDEDTTARVEYLYTDAQAMVREYAVKAHSRTTVDINYEVGWGTERDVSLKVTSPGQLLCERPMYFKYHGSWEGGHDVIGSTRGERTWFFPTASCGPGFESWVCVANPGNTTNKMMLEVFGDGGDYNSAELEMEPRSRATFDVNALAATVRKPWLKVSGTADLIAERPTYFSYTPKVDSQPFKIATWGNVDIKSPVAYGDLLGCEFHEAVSGDGCPPFQPLGTCLKNENAGRMAPGIGQVGSDPYYWIESTRGRGTYSTTACDVHAKAGATVYSPVNGTVVAAESYMLYTRYPDFRVKIAIDGKPYYYMECLHMSSLSVSNGQRVEAGKTRIGAIRDLVPYFNSGPNANTHEEGNHSHIQINYAPPGAAPGTPSS